MQYHASLITADGAYHCPGGSIMAIFTKKKTISWRSEKQSCAQQVFLSRKLSARFARGTLEHFAFLFFRNRGQKILLIGNTDLSNDWIFCQYGCIKVSRNCPSIEDHLHFRCESCEKEFPSHTKLTPGLYLVTCGCKYKCVYGFSMMTWGESPSMLFNLVMNRFEDDYNPQILYDASC